MEMRKKLLEEYVQHVYRLKLSHQAQLEKVEEIYKTNLDEMADIVDGDVEASVRNVRQDAERALERLRSESAESDTKGTYLYNYRQNITKLSKFPFPEIAI